MFLTTSLDVRYVALSAQKWKYDRKYPGLRTCLSHGKFSRVVVGWVTE